MRSILAVAVAVAVAGLALCGVASAQYTTTVLHPLGASGSDGRGGWGGQQMGNVSSSLGVQHATVWSGSSGSAFDLHPFADGISGAYGGFGGRYIGYGNSTVFEGFSQAMLWTGS